jgi:hypothetical protein
MGELTVPLGLAVTATGLAAQRGAFASSLLPVCCVLASLAAVALFARVLTAVAISGWRLEAVDGGWFLTSAVLSGASIAATTIAATTCGLHSGTATGRPISRDTLRGQMRIGRDRAGAIVAVVRAGAAAEVKADQLRAA